MLYKTIRYHIVLWSVLITNVGISQYEWKSIGLRFGPDITVTAQELDAMRSSFSDATYLNNDFSAYEYDLSIDPLFALNTLIELDLCRGKVERGDRWLDKLEYHFFLGYVERRIGYDNRVWDVYTPNGITDETNGKIHREQYEFFWNARNFYAGTEADIKGRELGKRFPVRVGYGLRLGAGLMSSNLTSYYLEGEYHGSVSNPGASDPDLVYYFPPISYTEEEHRSGNIHSFSMMYGMLGSVEERFGAEKRFILGSEMRFGGYMMIHPKGSPVLNSTFGVNLFVGCVLGGKK